MKNYGILFALIMSLSLALAACGGGSGASTNMSVDMTEFMFNPTNYTVPAGEGITLQLTNNGSVEHEFVIMKHGTEVGSDFGDEDEENIYWEAELQPGETNTFTFTAPSQPGEYQVVCGIPGHYLAGMVAKLIVVAE